MLTTEEQVLEALLKIVCEVKSFAEQDVLPVSQNTLEYAEDAIRKSGWGMELTGRIDLGLGVFKARKLNQ